MKERLKNSISETSTFLQGIGVGLMFMSYFKVGIPLWICGFVIYVIINFAKKGVGE